MTKICTTIDQSKKFLDLGIDINTADMWYQHIGYSIIDGKEKPTYFPMVIRDNISDDDIPAWSLSALEKLMPFQIIKNNKRFGFKQWKGYNSQGETYCFEYVSNIGTILYETYHWNNPLDAAFEMIVWLKENNKLINMSYKYFPNEFSSYEDYIKYLKEKGLAIEVPEGMYGKEEQ